jgi:ectoine hydroxylase-related dioxygenase (phytanoyl-CoA dioxygenase family)
MGYDHDRAKRVITIARCTHSGRLLELARVLLDDRSVVCLRPQCILKPPRWPYEVPPHQDGFAYSRESRFITMWIPLETMQTVEGPVEYAKGTHLLGPLPHGPSGIIGFQAKVVANDSDFEFTPKNYQLGDVAVHHPCCVHRSGTNRGSTNRPVLSWVSYTGRLRTRTTAGLTG